MNRYSSGLAAALVAATLAFVSGASAQAPGQVPLDPKRIPQFVQPLDTLTNGGLPLVINDDLSGATSVELSICEFQANILPAGTRVVGAVAGVAPATAVWGYQVGPVCVPGLRPRSYLGPVVVADRHAPTQITFSNQLPGADQSQVKAYTASTDQTLIWGDPLNLDAANNAPQAGAFPPEANECWKAAQTLVPPNLMPAACNNNYGFLAPQPTTLTYAAAVPAAVHLHGGEVPAELDGGPDAWWTANGIYGHGYYSKGGFAEAALGKATYVYPNGQEAAPIWFHDHMLGATRLNVYAGIAGGYVIKEPPAAYAPGLHPLGLSDTTWAPGDGQTENDRPLTELTVPLIIQDRMFDNTGQLYFPSIGINPEHPFWVPEFVGDVIVVNGKAWPFLEVQPKRYRFIFLNGSNARAYELFLVNRATGVKGPSLWVIGNDQGLLDAAREVNPNLKSNDKLAIMPGERYEVIVDFSTAAGQTIEMRNTARTPYVGGAPVNGNTTGRIMQFKVLPATPGFVDNSFRPTPTAPIRAASMVRLTDPLTGTPTDPVTGLPIRIDKVRRLTLNEAIGPGGPLEVLVNNTLYDGSKARSFATPDFKPITTEWNTTHYSELPHEGETELWEIVNLTADAHPMHPHLVAFQVLNRQALDLKAYTAAYDAAYVASGMATPAGLPKDGIGPPLDYTCGLRWDDPNTPQDDPGPVPPRGPIPCTLGGNPDPANLFGTAPPVVPVSALVGPVLPPMPQETGWKDTVQALPNMVTRILVRFAKTDFPNDTVADAAGYDFSPSSGHGYVWHCHIVDHEDNEMMRPFSVFANPTLSTRGFVKGVDY